METASGPEACHVPLLAELVKKRVAEFVVGRTRGSLVAEEGFEPPTHGL